MSTLHLDIGPPASYGETKVMLATTAYDSPDDSYTFSIACSRKALEDAGIRSAYLLLSGNCHVDDARNSVVHSFMDSDCTDLVFLDADVSWRPQDLVRLCQHERRLVGGVYPYRREDGKAKRGMPYIPLEGAQVAGGLMEVAGLPTGFLRINREVFDTLIPLGKVFNNKRQYVEGKKPLEGGAIPEVPLLFERTLVNGTRLGGDLNFCAKWIAAGGNIWADIDCKLGHVAKTVLKDSLAAFLRRNNDQTLQWMVDRIRRGVEELEDYEEVFDWAANPWCANNEVLLVAVSAARKSTGPIIETGSGLTTVLMAAATDQTVFCIEHNPHFANVTRAMVQACALTNVAIIHTDIIDGWYALTPTDKIALPAHFGLGLNDGPPRQLGDRTRFLTEFGHRCDMIVCDDADDPGYAAKLTGWAEDCDRSITFPEGRSAIIMKEAA